MNRLKTVIVLVLLLATSFSILIPTVSNAASPTSYVAITLTNSQTSATPKNFSQLIKVNWSAYATDLNANISNVRFYNSTSFSSSNELSGWIEDNNTTTATSSNVWVNLSGTIVPSSGTATIYMAFLPTASSWSSHWGLAPQLSTKYGLFDNGIHVFIKYWNFAGTTLPAGLTSAGTVTINNGSTVAFGGYLTTTETFLEPAGQIVDFGFNAPTSAAGNAWYQYGYVSQSDGFTWAPSTAIAWNVNDAPPYFVTEPAASTILDTAYATGVAPAGTFNIGSVYWNSTFDSGSVNYSHTISYSSDIPNTALYAGINNNQQNGNPPPVPTLHFMRIRTRPPDGVMPSVTFGSLTTVSVSGHQISFQQTSLPSGTKWGIRLNNTSKVIWQNSTTQYDNITGLSGTYTFQVINATGYASNPYTGVLDVSTANLTQSITFTGYATTFTESGLPSGDTWYVNLSDQPGLSESSTGQKLSGTTSSLTIHEPNGTYSFTYQTSDKRYSGGTGSFTVNGASVTENVTFSAVLYYLNFTPLSKPKSIEWGVNVSGTIKTGYGNLSFQLVNGTYYWNASAINGSFTHPIGWWRLTNGSGTVLLHNESSFAGMKIVINGKNYLDNVTFARAYNITFEEVGIGNTFQWDVNLSNGLGITSDKHIIVSDNVTQAYFNSTEGNYTNGTYAGSIELLVYGPTGVRYINLTASKSISEVVNGTNLVFVYNFLTQYYLTTSSDPVNGGYHSPDSGWFNASVKVQLTANSNSSFEFTGFQGTNTSSYTGMGYYSSGQYITTIIMTNPITEVMDFNNYIVLTFYMENLTSGTEWGVKLTKNSELVQWNNGTGYYIVFDIGLGTYSYQITGVKSTPQSNQISITSSTEVLLQYDITTYDVNFKEQSLQPGTNWNVEVLSNSFSYTTSGTSSILNFEVPNGSYSYTAGSVYGYVSNNSSGSFTVAGKSLLIYVNWTQGNAFILEGIRHFVAIYLNTSDFSIAAGTQIPINVNWSKYSSFENNNLSNVIFLNSTFYPLYAWIENNASASFNSSTAWVKLTSQIPYNSSMTIYLAWQSKDRNNFNKFGYLGEASQLSPMYGEWNNIRFVMNQGLVYQVYYPSIDYQINSSDLVKLQTTNMVKGSSVYSVFNSTVNYGFTQVSGTTNSVYYTNAGGTSNVYDTSVVENNVLFTYGLWSALDTFPNPVGFNINTAFLIKMFGFANINTLGTYYYTVPDNVMQIWEDGNNTNPWTSMSGMKEILNANQQESATSTVLSASAMIQGTERLALIYAQGSPNSASLPNPGSQGPANMNLWTSSSVSYYSPTPVNTLPTFAFGSPASSYNSFYEYGLPVGTNWSIAISGPGISKLYTTNSNLIYTYLPNGTYLYTVGSYINGSYRSGIDGNFIPSPGSGHVIVTGAFTVQVIIFSLNKVLKYNLEPEQASGTEGNISLPILVTNIQGLPASQATINNVIKYLNATLIAKQESSTTSLTWKISSAKTGMIVIFLNLTPGQLSQIKNGTAVVSFVSGFQLGTIEEVAAGVAGTNVFSSVSGPPVTNTTLPSSPGVSSINQIISYLAYLETTPYGRAMYLTLVLLGILAYTITISKHVKSRKKSP